MGRVQACQPGSAERAPTMLACRPLLPPRRRAAAAGCGYQPGARRQIDCIVGGRYGLASKDFTPAM